MATVTATLKATTQNGRRGIDIQQWSGTSASNTIMTIASGSVGPRRLVSVSVVYGAAFTGTVTITHNYLAIGGTSFDDALESIVFAGNTSGLMRPTGDEYLNDGDTITVVCPALAGQTSRVVLTLEQI
jgi:hypothetical protein